MATDKPAMVIVPAVDPTKSFNQVYAPHKVSRFPVWKKSPPDPTDASVAKHERMIDSFHRREDARVLEEAVRRKSGIKSKQRSTTATPPLSEAGPLWSSSPAERRPFDPSPLCVEPKDPGIRSDGSSALSFLGVDSPRRGRPSIKIPLPVQKPPTPSLATTQRTTVFDGVRPIAPAPVSQSPRDPRWEVRPIPSFSSSRRPSNEFFPSHPNKKRYKQRSTPWVRPSGSGTGRTPPKGPRAEQRVVDTHSLAAPASSHLPPHSPPSIPVANCGGGSEMEDMEIDPPSPKVVPDLTSDAFTITVSDLDELESRVASSVVFVPRSAKPLDIQSPKLAGDSTGKPLDVEERTSASPDVEPTPCTNRQVMGTESKSEKTLDALPAERKADSQIQAPMEQGEEESISPAREIKLWTDGGLSALNRWNLEDRAKSMDGVIVVCDSDAADFALLDIPPGRTACNPRHIQLFKRSLIPISSHWVLESAKKGKVLDVLPYLVLPTDPNFPAVNSGSDVVMKEKSRFDAKKQLQAQGFPSAALRRRIDEASSDEDDAPLARRNKKARLSRSPSRSLSPELFDEVKAKRFVSAYNKARDKHRKWMYIADENPEYAMSPQDWRDYMNENKSELEALGMQPAIAVRRVSTVGRKSSKNTLPTPSSDSESSGSESSGSESSVSTRLEAESELEGAGKGTETVESALPGSRNAKRVLAFASAKHLFMLKEKLKQRQPKDKKGYLAVYQELSRITADMQIPRSVRGFTQLHRRNTIPGWPWHAHEITISNDTKYRTDSSGSSDNDSGNGSSDNTPETQDEDGQESLREGRPEADAREVAEGEPQVSDMLRRPEGWLGSDDWRPDRVRILYEHLSKWDPSVMRKTAYIYSLADQQPGTKATTWYSLYQRNREFYEERFPQLVVRRTSGTYRSADGRASNGPPNGAAEEHMMEDEVTVVLDNSPTEEVASANGQPMETRVTETPAVQQSSAFATSFVLPHTPVSPFGAPLPLTKEVGSFTGSSLPNSVELAIPDDPRTAARAAGLKQYNIARWLTPAEEDDLERFVATREVDVPWDDILHQWPQACSALPFTPRHVQVILQLIDFDVFEDNIARRRAEAEAKGMSIEWWQPSKCLRCNGRSPDLNGNHCHDCRMALAKGPRSDS